MEKLAKVWLAGPHAQRRYKPRSHWRADGDHDYRCATDLISVHTASDRETAAFLHLLEIQTQQELENENVWMRVEAVADAHCKGKDGDLACSTRCRGKIRLRYLS